MELKEFEKEITAAVERYIADEETYDDNAQLQIDPETYKVTVVDSDEAESESTVAPDESEGKTNEGEQISPEVAGMDYIDVMELVKMSRRTWQMDSGCRSHQGARKRIPLK